MKQSLDEEKTTLTNDAEIYQKRTEKSNKEDFHSLSGKDKFLHIKHYYLKPFLLILILLIMLSAVLFTVFRSKPKTALSIAVVNQTLTKANKITLNKDISKALHLDSDKETLKLDASYIIHRKNPDQVSVASQERLTSKLFSQTIDVILCNTENFEALVKQGYVINLSTLLTPAISNLSKDQFVTCTDSETNKDCVFGISLNNNTYYQSLNQKNSDTILCVTKTTKEKKNIMQLLNFLFR